MRRITLSREIEARPDPRDVNAWKGVWVIGEPSKEVLAPVTAELLSKGRELADKRGVGLSCVLLGHGLDQQASEAICHSADRVLAVDHPALESFTDQTYGEVVARLAMSERPEIILAPSTQVGRAYIPRVATALETGLTADCTGLDVDQDGTLLQTRPTFGGNLMATIVCPRHRPQMATVRPHVLRPSPRDPARSGEVLQVEVDRELFSTGMKVLETVRDEVQGPDICSCKVVVAAGRGLDAAGVEMAKELAELLDGGVGATRPVVDAGLLPDCVQIGQTGVTVAPRLYIGLGVSGAIQHTVGMQGSEIVVAINKDPDAPIFDMATYGIVADTREILPLLLKRIRELRG